MRASDIFYLLFFTAPSIYIALIKEYEKTSSAFYDINLHSLTFVSKIKNRSLHYNDIQIMYVKLSDKLHCKTNIPVTLGFRMTVPVQYIPSAFSAIALYL